MHYSVRSDSDDSVNSCNDLNVSRNRIVGDRSVQTTVAETVLKYVSKELLELKCDFVYEIGIQFHECNPNCFSADTLHCTRNNLNQNGRILK